MVKGGETVWVAVTIGAPNVSTFGGLWENWHHPQSGVSSSRDRNSLRIGEVFDLL